MLSEHIARHEGLLKLSPTFVYRFYADLNRMGQSRLKRWGEFRHVPERWIASSVTTRNRQPIDPGGLSMLAGTKTPVSLRDAIAREPNLFIGEDALRRCGATFPVLVKILDPGEAIPFHLHASDAQVKRFPAKFPGQRFGKDEAYYFLDAPKGPMPYTHAGLHRGVTKRELIAAVKRGPEAALELSPSIYQEIETGFFVPAAIPHRPGTALTLEIQQPSDVSTVLQSRVGGRDLSPQQMHPHFDSIDDALSLVDFKLSERVGAMDGNRLVPVPKRVRGGEIATIFPEDVCRTFAGQRIRVTSTLTLRETSAVALFVWRGRGTFNGVRVRGGDEFFVTFDAATRGLEISSAGDETLECFTFRPCL